MSGFLALLPTDGREHAWHIIGITRLADNIGS